MAADGPHLPGQVQPLPASLAAPAATQPAIRPLIPWAPMTRLGQRFGRTAAATLRPMLGDEQILWAARVEPGRAPRVVSFALATTGAIALLPLVVRLDVSGSKLQGAAFVLSLIGSGLLTMAPMLLHVFFQRQVLLVATGQRLSCWRLTAFRRRPVRELFTMPLGTAHVTGIKAAEYSTVITCDRADGTPLKLTAVGARHKSDLSKVIAAAQQAGAWFEIRPPRIERRTP